MPLFLAEKGYIEKDVLVSIIQMAIQEEGPLTDEEANRFINCLKDSPFAESAHIIIKESNV